MEGIRRAIIWIIAANPWVAAAVIRLVWRCRPAARAGLRRRLYGEPAGPGEARGENRG